MRLFRWAGMLLMTMIAWIGMALMTVIAALVWALGWCVGRVWALVLWVWVAFVRGVHDGI